MRFASHGLALPAVLLGGIVFVPRGAAAPLQESADTTQGAEHPGLEVIASALALRETDEGRRADVLRRISALGPDAVHTVVALCSGRVSPADEQGPLIDAAARDLLREALHTWPRDRVVTRLLRELEGGAGLGTMMETVTLLSEVGGVRASGRLLEALSALDPRLLRAPCFQVKLEEALRAAVRADPTGVASMRPHLAGTEPSVLACTARALTDAQGSAPVALWLDMLHVSEALDVEVLKAMGEVDLRSLSGYDDRRTSAARELLRSDDRRTRRTAAIVLGRLGDVDSFEDLLDLLEDGDPAVVRGALEALHTLSRLSMPPDVERWEAWYLGRLDWLELRAPELAVLARSGSPEEAFDAIGELASVPLFRRELSLFVSEGLDHPDPGVAAAACHGLQALGEPTSVLTLIDCLEDRREPVRRAASTALQAITGEALPSESELWMRWLKE